jgi:hypothetical protein
MNPSNPAWLDPGDAERQFAELLVEAGLPRFDSTSHDPDAGILELSWEHGLTLHLDLTRGEISPLEDWERKAIFGEEFVGSIDVTVPGSEDPRTAQSIPGVTIHHAPSLHPDDVTVHNGIPVTSPSRTLIDLAECMTIDELRAAFARARELGLLDPEALHAARARVEWRPSLVILDEVIAEFCH